MFREHSPLNTPAAVEERLGKAPPATQPSDDRPPKQAARGNVFTSIYVLYVPPRYDGSKPYGVIYEWAHHDHNDLWDNWSHKLDSLQCIYIGPTRIGVSDEQAVSDALDAIYNLQQNYNINPDRVYFYGSFHGLPVYLALADVFRACVLSWHGNYFHPLVAPNGTKKEPTASEPNPKLLEIAKLQPFVFGQSGTDPNFVDNNLPRAMIKDGFVHVKVIQQPPAELAANRHFLMETVEYFDSYEYAPRTPKPTAGARAVTPPSAEAAANRAQTLLSLAQNYLDNHMTDMARRKLQEIIAQYPNDPAAARAREMLDKMGQ